MKGSEEADTSRCHDFIHYFKWSEGTLQLSQKTLSSRLALYVTFPGRKTDVLPTPLWWSVFSVRFIIHMFEWAMEVNVQSQVSSFISLDGSWKELVSWEKIISFFDHSNICVGFQLAVCSVSWEIASDFLSESLTDRSLGKGICNPLSREQPVLSLSASTVKGPVNFIFVKSLVNH